MTIELRVNSETFEEYQSITLNRGLNKPSGAFRIDLSPRQIDMIMQRGRKGQSLPIKVGDLVQIVIDNEIKLTGYVDRVAGSGEQSSHDISFSGRDKTQDLIDSSIPPGAKNINTPLTLAQFCSKVISSLGASIPVTDTVLDLTPIGGTKDTLSGGSSSNCMQYLTEYARKIQAYIIPDGVGGIKIFRPSGVSNGSSIINRIGDNTTNVMRFDFEIDYSRRFRKYVCKSQDNFGHDPTADYTTAGGTNRSGSETDSEIRNSRYLEILAEKTMTNSEVKKRVKEEANLRRAMSNSYSCTMQGFSSNANIVWDIGQSVLISDDFAQKQGVYTITDVTYNYNMDTGSTVDLSFADPDAFAVIPLLTDRDAARSGQNNVRITTAGGYEDNDWINRNQSVSITDTFNEEVGE